jgi:hypothetical protein
MNEIERWVDILVRLTDHDTPPAIYRRITTLAGNKFSIDPETLLSLLHKELPRDDLADQIRQLLEANRAAN